MNKERKEKRGEEERKRVHPSSPTRYQRRWNISTLERN